MPLRSDCVTERGVTQLGSSLGFPAHQFVCSAWKASRDLLTGLISSVPSFLLGRLRGGETGFLSSWRRNCGNQTAGSQLVVGSLYRVTVSARACFIELCGFLFCPTEHSVKRNSDALREDDCTWYVPIGEHVLMFFIFSMQSF